jgi:hypothetical protein
VGLHTGISSSANGGAPPWAGTVCRLAADSTLRRARQLSATGPVSCEPAACPPVLQVFDFSCHKRHRRRAAARAAATGGRGGGAGAAAAAAAAAGGGGLGTLAAGCRPAVGRRGCHGTCVCTQPNAGSSEHRPAALTPPQHYECLAKIGEGTYGIVLKAKHLQTGELCAVKRFKESENDEQAPADSGCVCCFSSCVPLVRWPSACSLQALHSCTHHAASGADKSSCGCCR